MRLLFLTGSRTDPSSRFRVLQFAEPFRRLGHKVCVRCCFPPRGWAGWPFLGIVNRFVLRAASLVRVLNLVWRLRDIRAYDVVFMNRDLLPEVWSGGLEAWFIKKTSRIIFDFDDAIFLSSRSIKLEKILPLFARVAAGNHYLAEYARQHQSKVVLWPTVLDTERFCPAKERTPGILRLGWSGSSQTLKAHLPMLKDILEDFAGEVDYELVVCADVKPAFEWKGVRIRFLMWSETSEVEALREMDIGLMPLPDQSFENGKCGFKAIQYMACGIPALVSPVGANREIVVHGETGFHCGTRADWTRYLNLLAANPSQRSLMGRAARVHTLRNYSLYDRVVEMEKLFRDVAGGSP